MPRRYDLARLPLQPPHWEVVVFPVPPGRRTVLVVTGGPVQVRLYREVAADDPDVLIDTIAAAFTAPDDGAPCRPPVLHTKDPALARLLGGHLTGVPVAWTAELPAITEGLAIVSGGMMPVAPGIHDDLDAWRVTLHALIHAAPWTHVTDDVVFRLSGGPVDGALAMVKGARGEIRSVLLFSSEEALAAADAGQASDRVGLFVEPRGEQTEAERQACRAVGLELPGPLWPRVFSLSGGQPSGVAAGDQARLRLAVVAVTAMARAHPGRVGRGPSDRLTLVEGPYTLTISATTSRREVPDLGGGQLMVVERGLPDPSDQGSADPRAPTVIMVLRGPQLRAASDAVGDMFDLLVRPDRRGEMELVARRGMQLLGRLGRVSATHANLLPSGATVAVVVLDKRDMRAPVKVGWALVVR